VYGSNAPSASIENTDKEGLVAAAASFHGKTHSSVPNSSMHSFHLFVILLRWKLTGTERKADCVVFCNIMSCSALQIPQQSARNKQSQSSLRS
jgi:hypothetical protein